MEIGGGWSTRTNEYCAATGALTRRDIARVVSNHPRAAKIEAVLLCRAQ